MNVRINLCLATLILALCACTKLQELPAASSGNTEDAAVPGPMGGNGGSAGEGGTSEPDAGPPPCPAGSVGCPCTGGQCNEGLTCQDSVCASATCGDGKQDPGEACDRGSANDDASYGGCGKNCALGPHCGDGVKNGAEACDDGNKDDSDLCSNACMSCSSRSGSRACGNRCLSGVECCSGEQCGAPSCAGNVFTAGRTCDGAGKCPAAVAAECGSGFSCDGTLCRSSCSSDTHCAGGRTCSNGACVVKGCGNGVIEAPETCEDGNTVDDDGCSNGCVKCANRTGYRECSVNGSTKCLANAVCCPGSTCRPAGCAGVNQTSAQVCNDKGECPVGAGTACSNNLICEANACRPSCGSDAHCLNGRICFQASCIVPACGNGVVEPGESCDNGNSNADSATCGTDCKTCSARGRKDCSGVCLQAGQCCSDSDCPAASTGGRCNTQTRACWKRTTVKFTLDFARYCARGFGCPSDPNNKLYLENGTVDKIWLQFGSPLTASAVVESATLTMTRKSTTGAYRFLVIRVGNCPDGTSGFGCQATEDSVLLRPNPDNLDDPTYSANLTNEVRSGAKSFVPTVMSGPSERAELEFFKKGEGALEPGLSVTYISP